MLRSHINPLITAGNGFSFGSLRQFVPVGSNTKYQLTLLEGCQESGQDAGGGTQRRVSLEQ